jgi:anti-anti-sigma regulatory factor
MKTIKLPREMGIKKARKLYDAAAEVTAGGPDCALDFTRVRRVDLSIAQVVMALGRKCRSAGGRLEIRNANGPTARLLWLAGAGPDGAPDD